jgi:hypothetical protein
MLGRPAAPSSLTQSIGLPRLPHERRRPSALPNAPLLHAGSRLPALQAGSGFARRHGSHGTGLNAGIQIAKILPPSPKTNQVHTGR